LSASSDFPPTQQSLVNETVAGSTPAKSSNNSLEKEEGQIDTAPEPSDHEAQLETEAVTGSKWVFIYIMGDRKVMAKAALESNIRPIRESSTANTQVSVR